MTNLIHICTDQDGIETWYEQTQGKFGPGLTRVQYRKDGKVLKRLPRANETGEDPELIKAMPEDDPE